MSAHAMSTQSSRFLNVAPLEAVALALEENALPPGAEYAKATLRSDGSG
jgi:hypothetical protein